MASRAEMRARKNRQDGLGKMYAKLTAAEKIVRRFKAGAPIKSDISKSPLGAVAEAQIYIAKIAAAMKDAELDPNDAGVGLIFTVAGAPLPKALRVTGDGIEAARSVMAVEGKVIGLLFTVIDREKDGFHHGWARRFVADSKAIGDVQELANGMGVGHA